MDAEFLQLAQEAVTALQAMAHPETRWIEVAQLGMSGLTLLVSSILVLYGFRLMRLGTEQRREEAQQQHTATMTALHQQGEVLAELLRRSA
jgi:cell division protein FtsB